MEERKQKIRTFLEKYIKGHKITDEADIFKLGFINSLFAMQLVMFIEKEFKIVVDNKDLDMENFSSINSISALVESKLA